MPACPNVPAYPNTGLRQRLKVIALWFIPLLVCVSAAAAASIPATPVMTLYRFNGDLELPYYEIEAFARNGTRIPAGTLVQGTTVIPCLVIRNGTALTDASGTPFVGFEIVVDPRTATPAATTLVRDAIASRRTVTVKNHHCAANTRHVIDVRNLYAMDKVPFFTPPRAGTAAATVHQTGTATGPDAILRAFHNSPQCDQANSRLIDRRHGLGRGWDDFARVNAGRWPVQALSQARQLDYTMRTALFEGHLDRGCNAYGACERNIVALTIRNRALERCFPREGCRHRGDFEGVAATVSQYNIWDEYLTQISGLTACFLREDLAEQPYYGRLQAMYAQNVDDMQRILFGSDTDLLELFTGAELGAIKRTAHYYHAPAMGTCFPDHVRAEYMTGAIARRGDDFALIANTRIHVDAEVGENYRFRAFSVQQTDTRDLVEIRDDYPGFVVDGRKVTLKPPTACRPYGIPAGCSLQDVGRHRRTPFWLEAGTPQGLTCRIAARTESCAAAPEWVTVQVGGMCDREMRPVSGVH